MKFLRSLQQGIPNKSRGFALAVFLVVVSVGSSQNRQSLLPTDRESRQAVTVAASAFPPEQATSDIVRLAGEYSYGNGLDMNCTLEISPDGRFLYKRCNCETVIDQSAGTVDMQDGRVILNPEKPRESWPRGTSSVMIPVAWGQRLYLIPQNDIAGFSNQVNRGLEPVTRGSMGSYYLREGDWDRPVTGKPELPAEWKQRLLDEPVTGMVAGRDPSNRWIINLGKDHGVYDDMELSAWTTDRQRFVTLRVTETGTHTSAVEIVNAPANLAIQGWTVYSKVAPPQRTPPPVTMPVQATVVQQPVIGPQLPQPAQLQPLQVMPQGQPAPAQTIPQKTQ